MTSKPVELPKDLKIEMGTKEEAHWTKIKEQAEETLLKCKAEIHLQEAILSVCNDQIEEEKGKL